MSRYNPEEPRIPKGRADGGRWTRDGDEAVRPAFFAAGRLFIDSAVEAGLAVFDWLSALNSPDKQAIIGFNARDYRGAIKVLDLADIRLLDREQVAGACPKMGEVQDLTDKAAAVVEPRRSFLTAGQYGTAVHYRLSQMIQDLRDAGKTDLRAEVSYLKDEEERYGAKGTIRIDVFEKAPNQTVCVYDIKTGKSGLSPARMLEIATKVFAAYADAKRIIITEVRPKR